jgi:hypothetical protein
MSQFYLGVGIINLFGDICILAIPISSVMKLHMERAQKIAICFMFLLGSLWAFLLTPSRLVADKHSVCFASLYRIITITRLVQTRDISWAKSDVFIWSSVEPSIGIISGCLPTLRPWRKLLPSSNKSSSAGTGKNVRPYPLNDLETISKKRTRKISKKDELESLHFTQLDNEAMFKYDGAVIRAPPRAAMRRNPSDWRPDDDEMCLTTTTIHRSQSEAGTGGGNRSMDSLDKDGITMTRKFEWDETRHS